MILVLVDYEVFCTHQHASRTICATWNLHSIVWQLGLNNKAPLRPCVLCRLQAGQSQMRSKSNVLVFILCCRRVSVEEAMGLPGPRGWRHCRQAHSTCAQHDSDLGPAHTASNASAHPKQLPLWDPVQKHVVLRNPLPSTAQPRNILLCIDHDPVRVVSEQLQHYTSYTATIAKLSTDLVSPQGLDRDFQAACEFLSFGCGPIFHGVNEEGGRPLMIISADKSSPVPLDGWAMQL